MAHFIYEYSANLSEEALRLPELMEKIHRAAADSGIFPESGLRSRAVRCEVFRVGDGDPANAFLNLSMKVGRGRDLSTRVRIGGILFETLADHLQPVFDAHALALSFEMRELDEHVKFNRKNF